MVAMFLNNGISIFKSDSRQEAHLPTKGDLKPTSYLGSTQKTQITAKKAQMRMVGLEITALLARDHSQQFAEQTQEKQSHT